MHLMRGESDRAGAAARGPWGWMTTACETAVILGVFAAVAAWPVPDVNETAYLTKARHAFDPSWCRGDFFLETPDAHGVFYLLMGPLTAAVTLERAAWIGRWLGWLALAVGFRHAVVPLLATGTARVLAAALMALLLGHTTAAGEWVFGGCEAKVFAWALVLAAIGEIERDRLRISWLLLGCATAVHPVVGGWGLVALVATVASFRTAGHSAVAADTAGLPDRWAVTVVVLVVGLLLAAAGVVPALGLSAGADAATRAAAARIHVVERLPHHLLPRTFADGMLARHCLAAVLWWLLGRLRAAKTAPRGGGDGASWQRVDRFILAALGIECAGHLIAACEPFAPGTVYSVLRFYWFRLADVLVPFGLATVATAVVCDDRLLERFVPVRPFWGRFCVLLVVLAGLVHESRHWPLPGRTTPAARSDTKVDAIQWREACDWVAAHAPADACFLTPRGAASFTWWTGRREVVGWKNSPQDARSLVEWRRRFADCFSRDGSFTTLERSTAAFGADRVRQVAERYGATHAIVPRDLPAAADLPFDLLHANRGYLVYDLAPIEATDPGLAPGAGRAVPEAKPPVAPRESTP